MSSASSRQTPVRPETVAAETRPATRLWSLDALRGLIMIVMALDHANLFLTSEHARREMWDRPVQQFDSALPFLTRLITHLAAPGFFFLMGAGMTLFNAARAGVPGGPLGATGWQWARIARHFALRGLLLIVFQVFVENPAWSIGRNFRISLNGGVLFGLGGAMILGAFVVRLPAIALTGLGLAAILATHLVLLLNLGSPVPYVLRMLFVPGWTDPIGISYPVIPWWGVTCLGMAFGRWLHHHRDNAYRWSIAIGALGLAGFVVIRAAGGFGNIRPPERGGWVAFLNVVKYPPSAVFLLLTLGTNFVLLGLLSRASDATKRWFEPVATFGRVPLFFYVTHLYLYGLLGLLLTRHSLTLLQMYPLWVAGLLLLYLPCRWFSSFKASRPPQSLVRMF